MSCRPSDLGPNCPSPCREIKLENAILKAHYKDGKSSQVVKLCDFAYLKNSYDTGRTSVVGPSAYMAPEVVDPRHTIYDAKKADLWSAGVVLYCLIEGRFPCGTEETNGSIDVLFKRIASLALDQPTHMSPGARDLMGWIFRPSPTRVTIQQLQQHWWFKQGALPEPREAPPPEREVGAKTEADLGAILDQAEKPYELNPEPTESVSEPLHSSSR